MKHLLALIIIFTISIYFIKFKENFPDSNFIDKIYFINLDKSPNRLEYIETQLDTLGYPYQRFKAVDGSKLNIKQLQENNILTTDKMMKGAIGCSLSHINLWKKIKKSKDNNVLVLEDDCIIDPEFNKKIKKYMKEIPKDFDIIYLGGSNIYGKKVSEHILEPITLENKSSTHNTGMYGMLINKKVIPTLLKYSLPINDNIDQIVKNDIFNKIKKYYIIPPLVNHNHNFKSMRRLNSNKNPFTYWSKNIQPKITIVR